MINTELDPEITSLLKRLIIKEMDQELTGPYLDRAMRFVAGISTTDMCTELLGNVPSVNLLEIGNIMEVKDLYEEYSHSILTIDNIYLAAFGIINAGYSGSLEFKPKEDIESIIMLQSYLPAHSCELSYQIPTLVTHGITMDDILDAAHGNESQLAALAEVGISKEDIIDAASSASAPEDSELEHLSECSHEALDIQSFDMLSVFEERLHAAEELSSEVADLRSRLQKAEDQIKELT